MKKMVCEICGSNEIEKRDGVFICNSCGTRYSTEEAKKLLVEVSGNIKVSGKVKVDSSDRLKNLFNNARRARKTGNYEEAAKYYDMILMDDPDSWEANFYSLYSKAMTCKIVEISTYATQVASSYPEVLSLIKKNVATNKQCDAVRETAIMLGPLFTFLYQGSYGFYTKNPYFDYESAGRDGIICCNGAAYCGEAIQSKFAGNNDVLKNAIIPLETCISLCNELINLRPTIVEPYILDRASRQQYSRLRNDYITRVEILSSLESNKEKKNRQAKEKIRRQEAAEKKKRDKERLEKEKAYFSEHPEEKQKLLDEKEKLKEEIKILKKSIPKEVKRLEIEKDTCSEMVELKKLGAKRDELIKEKANLNMFSFSRKKDLESLIMRLDSEIRIANDKASSKRSEIDIEIEKLEAKLQPEMKKLNARIREIDTILKSGDL